VQWRPPDRPCARRLASSVTDDDRRQPAKQYGPTRRTSNNLNRCNLTVSKHHIRQLFGNILSATPIVEWLHRSRPICGYRRPACRHGCRIVCCGDKKLSHRSGTACHSCFSRSGDMVGAHQNVNGSRDLTTPLSGVICIHGIALSTINLTYLPNLKFSSVRAMQTRLNERTGKSVKKRKQSLRENQWKEASFQSAVRTGNKVTLWDRLLQWY